LLTSSSKDGESVRWTSPSRDDVIGALRGGVQTSSHSGVSSLTTMHGFYAPIPEVSFHDIIRSGKAQDYTRFDFQASKIDTLAILSADLTLEAEVGIGGFKTCHPARLYSATSVKLMDAKEIVMKELYEKRRAA
jgi:hypothetical protein